MELVAATGAGYLVPTTKHHDGVTLWDAPGTGGRNTVHRGPHRDLPRMVHGFANVPHLFRETAVALGEVVTAQRRYLGS